MEDEGACTVKIDRQFQQYKIAAPLYGADVFFFFNVLLRQAVAVYEPRI